MGPKITKRIRLDSRNLITFGAIVRCACGKVHWVPSKGAIPLDIWTCDCGRPVALIGDDGRMYLVGGRVSERRVDEDEA